MMDVTAQTLEIRRILTRMVEVIWWRGAPRADWGEASGKPMFIPFEPMKAIQATAVLLKMSQPRRMSRLRLLKLLYIANRESLAETGRPITGDQVVAMDHGPVLSSVYNLIKGQHIAAPEWDRYIQRAGARDVELLADPGPAKLSRYEIAKLTDVSERFEYQSDWAVAEYTHEMPEWQKNKPEPKSCRTIPVEDVLDAVGLADEKEALLNDAAGAAAVETLLNASPR